MILDFSKEYTLTDFLSIFAKCFFCGNVPEFDKKWRTALSKNDCCKRNISGFVKRKIFFQFFLSQTNYLHCDENGIRLSIPGLSLTISENPEIDFSKLPEIAEKFKKIATNVYDFSGTKRKK